MSDIAPPPSKPPRIWVLHCPFRRTGSPVIGSFGATIRPVVIIPLETWNQLCQEIPALATQQFEVGAAGD